MQEQEAKAAFAAFLLENPDRPFDAALRLYPSDRDRGEACRITFAWPTDPDVIGEMERIKNSPTYYNPNIPSKNDLIKSALETVNNARTLPKDRIAALRLIAELQAMIVKPEGANDPNNRRMPTAPVYRVVSE